ncbi:chemotaxis protein CheD [Andreprevotia lacus DSM 23236]|jgi:chemotaxis protein CheD|uniref:Probable chemoreceptor glutamine deamidase CheD n=1 Tax=Andreprevotia lacus DSM 23236 TaxID=1121001 RepID=A0A1W1X8U8_9NEIS|nr:hypothetical protein [Andreprevotia lacus]SMC20366.1 chemotaxis protein CheD [Andreprevotia lacus DSM 23236]
MTILYGRQQRPQRYFDAHFQTDAIKVLPAQYCATDEDLMLVTVLGSCVSVCLHDPQAGVGGMNHFILPGKGHDTRMEPARFGTGAMALLLSALFELGARRQRLQATLCGAGNVLSGLSSARIGQANADFVHTFLRDEHIRVIAQDLLGQHARRLHFFPARGNALVYRVEPLPDAPNGTDLPAGLSHPARRKSDRRPDSA